MGLHESLGFAKLGVYPAVGHKLGEWHDVGWWQRGLLPSARNPQRPLGVETARNHAATQSQWKIVMEDGQRLLDRAPRPLSH